MRWVTATATALLVGLLLISCSAADEDSAASDAGVQQSDEADQPDEESANAGETEEAADNGSAEPAELSTEQVTALTAADDREVIYTIDLLIETDNLARATQRAISMTEASGGFVGAESTSNDDTATLTLRVPAAEHSSIVSQLEDLGDLVERNREADDVTSEVVDTHARIESQERSIARIRELLDDASDLDDVVQIESELARRESTLDSLLQRREELSSLTSLATVTVTFTVPADLPEETDDADSALSFTSGLRSGWDAFVATARVVGAIAGALLPFAVLAAVLGLGSWMLWRRLKPA